MEILESNYRKNINYIIENYTMKFICMHNDEKLELLWFNFHIIYCDFMKILIPFLITLIAGLSTTLGCVFIYIKPKNVKNFISISLSFSATIMILISITDLIPSSFFNIIENIRVGKALFFIVLAFFLGAFLINILDNKIDKYKNDNNLYKVGVLSAIVLVLHNLPEGVATFLSSYTDIKLGLNLALAISLHNIPEGITIAVPLYYSTKSKSRAIKATIFSGLSEVFGAVLAFLFLARFVNEVMISFILISVSGIMISLSINELYKEAKKYNSGKYFYLGIIIAFIFIIFQHLFF